MRQYTFQTTEMWDAGIAENAPLTLPLPFTVREMDEQAEVRISMQMFHRGLHAQKQQDTIRRTGRTDRRTLCNS